MNTPMQPPYGNPDAEAPRNPDLVEQAVPGHGVPSQDSDPAGQVGLTPDEAEREAKSVYVGGGAMAGLVAGAAAGAVIGGPIGVLVGGTAGTIAGVLGGEVAGQTTEPEPATRLDRLPTEAEIRSADDDGIPRS